MMPMLPAKAVSRVRAFLVRRLLKLRASEVSHDMDERPMFLWTGGASFVSSGSKGRVSSVTAPSRRRTMRLAYCSASSGLCVTMTTRRSFATSFSSSMTWMLVSLSSAPVGSSASRMSGLLTRARAMATRCIWPPDISVGRLWSWFPRPTCRSASAARRRRSAPDTPEMVRASSTLARTVWWGMRL